MTFFLVTPWNPLPPQYRLFPWPVKKVLKVIRRSTSLNCYKNVSSPRQGHVLASYQAQVQTWAAPRP